MDGNGANQHRLTWNDAVDAVSDGPALWGLWGEERGDAPRRVRMKRLLDRVGWLVRFLAADRGVSVLIALLYFLTAHVSLALTLPHTNIAGIWPPSGLLLAALVLRPRKRWPLTLASVAIVLVAANMVAGNGVAPSLAFTFANLAESLLAAWLCGRWLPGRPTLTRLRTVGVLVGAGGLSAAVAATLGAATAVLALGSPFGEVWRTWWIADGLGILLVGSSVLAWSIDDAPSSALSSGSATRALAIVERALFGVVALSLVVALLITQPSRGLAQSPYLLFPLLAWAATRFSPRAITLFLLGLALIVISATIGGAGPFAVPGQPVHIHLLDAQAFLVTAAISTLVLAAVMAERTTAQAALVAQKTTLEQQVAARTAELHTLNFQLTGEIAERAQAETTVRASEAQLRLLVDGINEYAIYMLDPHGRIARWSAGAARIKGYTSAEVLGRDGACFYPPDAVAAEVPRQELAMALATGRYEAEGWRVRKDGTRFWANIVISPVRDADGQLQGFAKITRDITPRVQMEATLRLQAQLLNAVQQAVIATNLDGQVTYWNQFAEQLYGWTATEAIGRQITDLTTPATTHEQAASIMQQLARGESWSGEFCVQRRDGTSFPALVIDSPVVDDAGHLTGIVGVSMDISAQVAVSEALRQAHDQLEQRVVQRTEELSAANASLHHELTERRRIEVRLNDQLRAQHAIARCAQILLLPTTVSSRPTVVAQALEVLRKAVRCEQACLYRNHIEPSGDYNTTIVAEAVSSDIPLCQKNALAQRTLWSLIPPAHIAALQAGTPVAGPTDTLFATNQAYAAAIRAWPLQSLVLYPVHTEAGWWGVIGFSETGYPRVWSDHEHLFLRTATDLFRHVVQRWEVEDALHDSERRFRGIFDSQFQFIGLLATDGTLLEANATALAFAGLQREEVVGRPFWEARWWTMSEATQAQLRDAIIAAAAGTFVRYEVEVRGQGDKVETIDFSLKPLYGEQGKVTLLIPEGRIITEQKRAVAALRRSEHRYRSLVAAAPVGIFETDPTGAVTSVNACWCTIAGMDAQRAGGYAWLQSVHPEDRDRVAARWRAFVDGTTNYHQDLRYQHADGTVVWAIADAVALREDDGEVLGYLGTVTDITARKQAELQLAASLAEKEVLLKEVHHRVKNNLQVVMSLLRLQSRTITDRRALAALHDSQQRIAVMTLVHELLYQTSDLAHLDVAVYLRRLVAQVHELYGSIYRVEVSTTVPTLPVSVALPCGLIVHELVTNSFKYAFLGGPAGAIGVDFHALDDARLQLCVWDTGVGIPVDESSAGSLGLQLVAGLVKQLRGTMTITGVSGTRVTMTFPSDVQNTSQT